MNERQRAKARLLRDGMLSLPFPEELPPDEGFVYSIMLREFVAEGKGSMACDIGPYYSPGGEIKPGYDHPLDLGAKERRKISGGEITGY